MIFYSFFKTLEGKTVVVELKNGVGLKGLLRFSFSFSRFLVIFRRDDGIFHTTHIFHYYRYITIGRSVSEY